MRPVTFRKPQAAGEPRWIYCRVSDASGALVWDGHVVPDESGLRAHVSVPPGTYRLQAYSNNELQVESDLSVHGLAGGEAPLELELRRAD